MKKIKLLSIAVTCITSLGFAQNPIPAKSQTEAIALTNATIVVGNGTIIPNGTIVFDKGVITAVGSAKEVATNGINVINIEGKSVYPGLISPNSQVGLQEFASVRTTHDFSEIGEFNPNVRALIAHDTDSEIIPTVRGNGVLIGQSTPTGGIISGTSSIMYFDGWNWEDAALKKDDGVWLNWPAVFTRNFDPSIMAISEKRNENYSKIIGQIRTIFEDAKHYAEIEKPSTVNLKLEALEGLFDGSKQLFIKATDDKQIIEAIQLVSELGIKKYVIVGAEALDMAIPLLKEKGVPVLINSTHRVPMKTDDEVWDAYHLPSRLVEAGLLVGMYYNDSNWRSRNLPFVAGNAAAYGLSKENALKLVTLNNAKILGIDSYVGTLEKGKHATLIVTDGDILDMRTAKVNMAFIQGKSIDLDDKQKRLYSKYKTKYSIK